MRRRDSGHVSLARRGFVALFGALAALGAWTGAFDRASAADLHAFWDSRCADCHRHAGEFARNHFKIDGGRLVGRNPNRDVCAYLVTHGAGPEMAGPICAMLTAQAATPSLFRDKCATCHGSAADLARSGLATGAGGEIVGKENGRPVVEFLATHGGLAADQVPVVVETLKRVLREVGDGAQR